MQKNVYHEQHDMHLVQHVMARLLHMCKCITRLQWTTLLFLRRAATGTATCGTCHRATLSDLAMIVLATCWKDMQLGSCLSYAVVEMRD